MLYPHDAAGFAIGDWIKVGSEYTKITAVSGNGLGEQTLTVSPALSTTPTDGVAIQEVRDGIKITIRNTGSVPAVIQTVYVYKGDTQILKIDGLGYAIQATSLGTLGLRQSDATWSSLLPVQETPASTGYVTFSTRLQVSTAYVVRVVTDNGFTVEGTYYTPSAFA